jgi:predicted membrane protein
MTQWDVVIISYALTIAGTAGTALWAWLAMRGAEKAAAELRRDK